MGQLAQNRNGLTVKTGFLHGRRRYWAPSMLCLLVVLILGYGLIEEGLLERYYRSHPNDLKWNDDWILPPFRPHANGFHAFPSYTLVSSLFKRRDFSNEELQSLMSWYHMNGTTCDMEGLPNAMEAVTEGQEAWERLMDSTDKERRYGASHESGQKEEKGKQCPYSIRKMNASGFGEGELRLSIPCGLVEGSCITLIGTPGGRLGEFRIDLVGTTLPREPDPPIVLHYNIRLHGDNVTEEPVIVQNTWTADGHWGVEERCPSPDRGNAKKVDELEQCSEIVGKDLNGEITTGENESAIRRYFPFQQGYLAISTLRIGKEGIQMAVDGKHITSFAYRDKLEPWLVDEVKVSGGIQLISMVANGLPTAEDTDNIVDLDALKAPQLPLHKPLALFIGIFSTANNFKRRMAVRRTWLQYPAVKSGAAAGRFFVGLHKNEKVNEELWHEAQTYGDIQLLPFVDYYTLITWKTVAICVYSTNTFSADYVMKTDDDSFIRIDEVLSSLRGINVTHGLLYGLLSVDDEPQRDLNSKWYISPEEWPYDYYPPWAHGPGYVISHDIARTICKMQKSGSLWIFKLEDVAMGIWIAQMRKNGTKVKYENDERIYMECQPGYMIAHYQVPRYMLCLWQMLNQFNEAICCE